MTDLISKNRFQMDPKLVQAQEQEQETSFAGKLVPSRDQLSCKRLHSSRRFNESKALDHLVENLSDPKLAPVPMRGVEPQISLSTVRDSSLWSQNSDFGVVTAGPSAADRGN